MGLVPLKAPSGGSARNWSRLLTLVPPLLRSSCRAAAHGPAAPAPPPAGAAPGRPCEDGGPSMSQVSRYRAAAAASSTASTPASSTPADRGGPSPPRLAPAVPAGRVIRRFRAP